MAELNCSLQGHVHERQGQTRLLLALLLCVVFMIIELVAGHLSGSLAIITDAMHLLSDVASFLISLLAIIWTGKPPTKTYTYGYYRAEILGALLSIFLIWVMAAFLLVEALGRLSNLRPVESSIMLVTAIIGVIVNITIGVVLYDRHSHAGISTVNEASHIQARHVHHQSLNLSAAFLHVLGDLLQSVGVVLAALIIKWKPDWIIVDPLCTFFFTAIVIYSTVYMLRDMTNILMEGCPATVDPTEIQEALQSIEGVQRVEDLHIWVLLPGTNCMTVRLKIASFANHAAVLTKAREAIQVMHQLKHSTIEIEWAQSDLFKIVN